MVFSLSIPVEAAQGTTQSGTCTDSQTLLLSNVDNFCEEFDIQQELPAILDDSRRGPQPSGPLQNDSL